MKRFVMLLIACLAVGTVSSCSFAADPRASELRSLLAEYEASVVVNGSSVDVAWHIDRSLPSAYLYDSVVEQIAVISAAANRSGFYGKSLTVRGYLSNREVVVASFDELPPPSSRTMELATFVSKEPWLKPSL